uniref:Uncharacterized protein n=1 Tax=Marseillevirus LCMAC102 TaxID=2506603 RepID=A0A481YSR8_9VIRU|nr:MAG: uncharacterized protein LCMAC102_00630 [Marseillevirus LCMAC102]
MPEFTSISRETSQQLIDSFKLPLKDLVFRRVTRVYVDKTNLLSIHYYKGPTIFSTLTLEEYQNSNYTKNQLEKIEFQYRRFSVGTSLCSLRNNSFNGIKFMCLSEHYAEIDSMTFQFIKKSCTVLPQVGDLVCMSINPSSGVVESWFTCSEQFMRMWTVLMFQNHPSFEARGREPRMRERLMSGNRLNTNSFLKWNLAHEQSGVQIDQEQSSDRYVRMRTEEVSRKWIHIYPAFVLMMRYGELPTNQNIPNNRDGGPVLTEWNLPFDFVEKFIQTHTTDV